MDNDNDILGAGNSRSRITADITYLMLKGGGYAAIAVLSVWLVIAVIAGIGRALPEESREAADPSPWSALEVAPALVATI